MEPFILLLEDDECEFGNWQNQVIEPLLRKAKQDRGTVWWATGVEGPGLQLGQSVVSIKITGARYSVTRSGEQGFEWKQEQQGRIELFPWPGDEGPHLVLADVVGLHGSTKSWAWLQRWVKETGFPPDMVWSASIKQNPSGAYGNWFGKPWASDSATTVWIESLLPLLGELLKARAETQSVKDLQAGHYPGEDDIIPERLRDWLKGKQAINSHDSPCGKGHTWQIVGNFANIQEDNKGRIYVLRDFKFTVNDAQAVAGHAAWLLGKAMVVPSQAVCTDGQNTFLPRKDCLVNLVAYLCDGVKNGQFALLRSCYVALYCLTGCSAGIYPKSYLRPIARMLPGRAEVAVKLSPSAISGRLRDPILRDPNNPNRGKSLPAIAGDWLA